MQEPSHRKSLNQEQLKVLYALYKFRFGTEELLALNQGNVSRRYTHERVRILCEQEYIGRRYDSSYRLFGNPATYYLLPKGIDILKQNKADFKPQVLRNIRRDIDVSKGYMWHCINVFRVYARFKDLHGDSLKFFTKSYLTTYDYFPKPLPDAYLSYRDDAKEESIRHYMLEYFDWSASLSAMKRKINIYINHADSGDWTPQSPYPAILLICTTAELEAKLRKWASVALENSWEDSARIYTTTKDIFFSAKENNIWRECKAETPRE